jgi:hypothetical protein
MCRVQFPVSPKTRVIRARVGSVGMLYDVLISHASEDKDFLFRPLAELLRDQHIEVWYDEFSLKVGDILRRSIDQRLSQSRFGIVVLSPNSFKKQWSQWELDGLVARQNSGGAEVILPVWHQVGRDEVLNFSPSLADKVAGRGRNDLRLSPGRRLGARR